MAVGGRGVPISQAEQWGQAIRALHPRQVGAILQVYPILNDLYCEGAYADSELAACAWSRGHHPDTKQANLAVDVMYDGHVPILVHALPGNTANVTRPLTQLHLVAQL